MNILFLTQYFPPEVGAPQNRLYELALRLNRNKFKVDVLTAMPNYPKMKIHDEYKGKFYLCGKDGNITIHRSYIYVRKSNSLFIRLLNYFSFVLSSMMVGIIKLKKYDYIFCESPPLFLGISALFLSKIKKAKLIFNVSDLWPESAEKLGLVKNRFLLGISTMLEEYLYKKSEIITGQTNGIIANINKRFPDKKIYWLPNGVDVSLFENNVGGNRWRLKNSFSEKNFLVFYGGIFGHAQGLDVILDAANKLKNNPDIKFIMMGDGPEKDKLHNIRQKLKLDNVHFFEPVPKESMPEIISSINVAVVPLKNIELFRGAIPSKIFEILASKKPVILGVEGEARDLFIQEGKGGVAFTPEDSNDLAEKILMLLNNPSLVINFGENGYEYVKENFNRDKIAEDFSLLLNQHYNS